MLCGKQDKNMVEVVNVDNTKEPRKTLIALHKMQQDQILTDVVLIAKEDGIRVPVHRNILSARCEYFRAMFTSDMSESMQTEISLSDVSGGDLINIIKYIYSGEIELSEENTETVMAAAHHFLLTDVVSACGEFLKQKIDSSNCLGFWAIAELHCSTNLITAAQAYACDRFKDVCKSEEFLKLGDKQLRKLLASDEVCVSEEETVFESTMRWLQHNKVERMKFIREILSLVRVPFLSPSFIMDQKQLILDAINDQELLKEIMTWYVTADMKHIPNPREGMSGTLLAIMMNSIDGTIPIHKCNSQTNEWTLFTQIKDGRKNFYTAIMNDELIIGEGYLENCWVNTVTSVNTKTMSSKRLNPMGKCRQFSSLVVLDEYVYATGGYDGTDVLKSVERWDHRTGLWTYVASMNVKRMEHVTEVLCGSIYVVGGGGTNSTECYKPLNNSWTMKASTNDSRVSSGAAVLNGYLYVVGGLGSATIERYDHITNTWTKICSLNTPRYGHSCIALNNSIIVAGGSGISIVEEYDVIANVWSIKSRLPYEGCCALVLARYVL